MIFKILKPHIRDINIDIKNIQIDIRDSKIDMQYIIQYNINRKISVPMIYPNKTHIFIHVLGVKSGACSSPEDYYMIKFTNIPSKQNLPGS